MFVDNSAAWGVARQVSLSLATIVAEAGFGVLSHKVAKTRTASDLALGDESRDDDVWLSSRTWASARPSLGDEHSPVVEDRASPYSWTWPPRPAGDVPPLPSSWLDAAPGPRPSAAP